MTETQIQKNIKDSAEGLGLTYYHTRNSFGSDKGFPDIVVSGPVDQLMWLGLLSASGLIARLIYEADLPLVYDDLEAAFAKHLKALRRG
jgi:hypothetical protein